MYTISELNSNDLDKAYSIELQSHDFPWTKTVFYSNQGLRYRNYKICDDHTILGFCIVQTVIDEATLFNVAVHPKHQHHGIARTLLNHVLELLHEEEIKVIWLEVRASNSRAISLYESLGFHHISQRSDYYPTPHGGREDALIMAKQLIADY